MIGLVATILVVWNATSTYPYQDGEQAFHAAINGHSHPTTSRGGVGVGVTQEQQMASYIDSHVHGHGAVLTDNSQTYAVILFSGHPGLFATRLDSGSNDWESQVKAPSKKVKYFLVASHDPADALLKQYPGLLRGSRTGLTTVYKDARYALLSVAPGTTDRKPAPAKKKINIPDAVISTVDTR